MPSRRHGPPTERDRILRVLPCNIVRGNAGRRDPCSLRAGGFPGDCRVEAWRSRGRRESRSTGPRAAASVTGLMVVGVNPHVRLRTWPHRSRPHQAGLRRGFPSAHPDVGHNPKPVRNGERRPPFSGRTKLRGECSYRMAGSAFSRRERLMRGVRVGQPAPQTREGSSISRPQATKAVGVHQEV